MDRVHTWLAMLSTKIALFLLSLSAGLIVGRELTSEQAHASECADDGEHVALYFDEDRPPEEDAQFWADQFSGSTLGTNGLSESVLAGDGGYWYLERPWLD